jgi:hypothetical protein
MNTRTILTAILTAASLSGCAGGAPACYVGLALFPLSPVVMCGVDLEPKEAGE